MTKAEQAARIAELEALTRNQARQIERLRNDLAMERSDKPYVKPSRTTGPAPQAVRDYAANLRKEIKVPS